MITFILTSRVKGSEDSNIELLLDSAQACCKPENIEFIIKYDDDDDVRPQGSFFVKYPFQTKIQSWSRGEGRHSIHLDHMYLFSLRDRRSRFVMICSDDFTFYRKGFDEDILSIQDDYCFVGYSRPPMEAVSNNKWREGPCMDAWKHNGGVCLPCFSTKTAEVLQNFGWQPNADNWQTLLNILMYNDYGLDLWKTVQPFYVRNPSDGTSGYGKSFNRMTMDGSRNPDNDYYYDLVKQQAKNLMLNIVYGSVQYHV